MGARSVCACFGHGALKRWDMMTEDNEGISARGDRDVVLQAKYRGLVEKYFDEGKASRLLACRGGMATICWVTLPFSSASKGLPVGPQTFCKLACHVRNGRSDDSVCDRRWRAHLHGQAKGAYRFTCPSGLQNFGIFLWVRTLPVGMVLAQSFGAPHSAKAKATVNRRGASVCKLSRTKACIPVMERAVFSQCVRLVELIVDDVSAHVENDLQREDLARANRAIEAHEASETQLRRTLNRMLPYVREVAAAPEEDAHQGKVVRQVLRHIHHNVHRPLSLPELAATVHLSAGHFSTVFSKHVGVSFRDYIKGLRLEKAQGLLRDPSLKIAEVAQAVGYADPNSFRQAFKDQTGFAPTVWRQTLRATPMARGGNCPRIDGPARR